MLLGETFVAISAKHNQELKNDEEAQIDIDVELW